MKNKKKNMFKILHFPLFNTLTKPNVLVWCYFTIWLEGKIIIKNKKNGKWKFFIIQTDFTNYLAQSRHVRQLLVFHPILQIIKQPVCEWFTHLSFINSLAAEASLWTNSVIDEDVQSQTWAQLMTNFGWRNPGLLYNLQHILTP